MAAVLVLASTDDNLSGREAKSGPKRGQGVGTVEGDGIVSLFSLCKLVRLLQITKILLLALHTQHATAAQHTRYTSKRKIHEGKPKTRWQGDD